MINIGTTVNLLCNPKLVDDYNKNDNKSEPIGVTFCIPGNNFTSGFFNSWTKFLFFLKSNPHLITPHFVNYHTNDLANTCNEMLGGNISKGAYQLPFDDDFETAFVFFIDPDKIFEPLQIMQIIYKMAKYNLNVLSGVYIHNDNLSIIKEDKESKPFCKEELINLGRLSENNVCKVENVGLGFVCIKNELFASIKYPWFSNESNMAYDLFRKMKANGENIYCDTSIFIQTDK